LPFDLQGTLRRLKPHKRLARLTRRADSELAWASDVPLIGGALMLDTSVYLDVLQARTPDAVDELLTYRVCYHSAVCLAELTHVFGRLDPANPSTRGVLQTMREMIEDIPWHRLQAPDSAAWGEAGILAGELFRLSGEAKSAGHERKYLNDALIYLQARGIGASVITGNVADFDFLNQLVPAVPIILYRQV
jgi:predicted nucleic acid-binding protein